MTPPKVVVRNRNDGPRSTAVKVGRVAPLIVERYHLEHIVMAVASRIHVSTSDALGEAFEKIQDPET
jgi:hypothetical protein